MFWTLVRWICIGIKKVLERNTNSQIMLTKETKNITWPYILMIKMLPLANEEGDFVLL